MNKSASSLRIGILGTSRAAGFAVIQPARHVPGIQVVAVASREIARARRYARKWRIAEVEADYSALLKRPDLDVIYVPLPAAWHCHWTVRALEAGKHVLCEKPMAANQADAERMRDTARRQGRLLIQAFHYYYHPLIQQTLRMLHSGAIGTIRAMHGQFKIGISRNDMRFDPTLAGGACMDIGCYPLHLVRCVMREEPTVTDATAELIAPAIDQQMRVGLRFPGGATASVIGSLRSAPWQWRSTLKVYGDQGSVAVRNPFIPHLLGGLTVDRGQGKQRIAIEGRWKSSYRYQLEAVVRAILLGEAMFTDGDDAVRTMQVIDACYRAAGLEVRRSAIAD